MKIKPIFFLSLLIATALLLSACGGGGGATEEAPAPAEPGAAEPEVPAEAPADEPVTLDVGTTYIWDTAIPTFG